jgi:hypothetical protein
MPLDLYRERDRTRLLDAIQLSYRELRTPRQHRTNIIKQLAGSNYADGGPDKKVVANLLDQTAQDLLTSFMGARPRVLVTCQTDRYHSFAKHFQLNLNKLFDRLRVEEVLSEVLMDAFIGPSGVVKVYQADGAPVQLEDDATYDTGQPFLERIGWDDFFIDLGQMRLHRTRFTGDIYRVSMEKVRKETRFDSDAVKMLHPTSKYGDAEREDQDSDAAKKIAAGEVIDNDEYEPMIDLMDVWLPELGKVATFAWGFATPPLAVIDWYGRSNGPYRQLALGRIPDNILPAGPARNLVELHKQYNTMLRKNQRQAYSQKDVPIYEDGSEDDSNRVRKASDGQHTRVTRKEGLGVWKYGGVDQGSLSFRIDTGNLYDRFAGNLKGRAGLGAQASTLGQEQIIQANIQASDDATAQRVLGFVSDVAGDLGYLMWIDENLFIESYQELEGPGPRVELPSHWLPAHLPGAREAQFDDYEFSIEPYSLRYRSPTERFGILVNILERLVLPLVTSGMTDQAPDVAELLRIAAEYNSLPELNRIMQIVAEQPGSPQQPRQSPVTSRENVRRNVTTGGTPEAQAQSVQQALLSNIAPRQQGVVSP